MKRLWLLSPLLLLLGGCASRPVPDARGLVNFGVVDASRAIFHCGALTPAGVNWLAAHGVTNVLKLSTWTEDPSDRYALARGLTVEGFPISGWQQATGEGLDVVLPMALLSLKPGTVIHCYWGRNRTMTLCGLYWEAVLGWGSTRSEAQMQAYGWGDSLPGLKTYFYGRTCLSPRASMMYEHLD